MAALSAVRVLIVEDEPTDAEILRRSLHRLEVDTLETTFASTAREAKQILASSSFDLLLLDLHLPDVIGYELIHEAKRIHKDLPVVVVTSLNDSDAALEVGKIGADDYIVKDDLMGSSLGRTVRRLLRARLQTLGNGERRPRLIQEPSDRIDVWLAWRFPVHLVPPRILEPEVQAEAKKRYRVLLNTAHLKNESQLKSDLREFENYAYEQKIPSEFLVSLHRELTGGSSSKDGFAGRQRFLLFELLAALLERYRAEDTTASESV